MYVADHHVCVCVCVNACILVDSTFGNQRYLPSGKDHELVPCVMAARDGTKQCVLSQLSLFQVAITASMPILGNVFFFSNLLLVIVFALTLFVGIFRRRKPSDDYLALSGDSERLDYLVA